jgi:hypothetical protein
MKRKLFYLMLAALLLAPWPVAYAYGNDAAGQNIADVAAATPSAAPQWHAYGNAIGSVVPGDLFYVDTANTTADIPLTLYLTNTGELVHDYRYLTLNIGVYIQTGDRWEKASAGNGTPLPESYLTMLNGQVSLNLPGNARYKITIDKGCFYCHPGSPGQSATSPAFYLAVER